MTLYLEGDTAINLTPIKVYHVAWSSFDDPMVYDDESIKLANVCISLDPLGHISVAAVSGKVFINDEEIETYLVKDYPVRIRFGSVNGMLIPSRVTIDEQNEHGNDT